MVVTVGAILVLGFGGLTAAAAQRDRQERHDRRERGGRERVGQARPRGDDARRDDARGDEGRQESERTARGDNARRGDDNSHREVRGGRSDRRHESTHDRREWRRDSRYYEPRHIYGHRPRRHYGSGGHHSIYFGLGSGYRYGTFYSGRVYGYVPPPAAYGVGRYYGDVRLRVRPRDAQVFVDGYYAGIVDNFDGVFQRLTLEVGPHQIEIAAPGFEPQVFDVYVDPTRTVDLHSDLFPSR
jgi:hypothetical protein